MPGEAILQIGAVFDKDGVDTGMTDVAGVTKQTMAQITAVVEQAGAATRKAFKGLSEDVKLAAESVSTDSLKIAEATKAQTAAMADLRRASIIARDAKVDDAVSTQILAAAQQKVTAASAELVAAKKIEAGAVTEATEQEVLSNNAIIASFQRVARAVMESTEVMREQMVETAESAELSAEGIQAGFGGLGKLLGAGLIVGFVTHFLDETAKVDVELDHLSAKTGIATRSLSGLQQLVKKAGGEWEAVAGGLVKMEKAQAQVEEGNKKLARAFSDLGITEEEVKTASPEKLLDLVAAAMGRTKNQAILVNSALAIFGKGGAALIPILREQAEALKANTDAAADQVGATDKAIAASRRWIEEMAEFSAGFKKAGNFILENLHYVEGAFLAFDAYMTTMWGSILTGWYSIGQGAYNFARIMHDAMTGNIGAIQGDWNQMTATFASTWKERIDQIKHDWQTVSKEFSQPPEAKEEKPDREGGSKDADETLKQDEAELNHLKILHHMSVAEEVKFWKDKLAAVKAGSDEYTQLEAKLAPLMERLRGEAGRGKGTAFERDEDELNEQKQFHQFTVGEEIDFWEKKKAAAVRGSKEYSEILKQITSLMQKKDKPEMAQEKDGDWQKLAQEEFIEGLREEVAATKTSLKQEEEAYREARDEEDRMARDHYQDVEKDSQFEVEMGRKTATQRLNILRQAANQELQVRMQAIRAKEALDMQDVKAYQQDLNRELQIQQQFNRQITQINEKAALDFKTNWDKSMKVLNAGFENVLDGVITKTQSVAQGFAKMFQTIILDLANFVLQWLLKKAELWAMDKIMQALGLGTQHAQQAASNEATVQGDAAVAAAGTMAYYSVIDPPVASTMAAIAFAETEAWGSMAAFEKGGMVTGGAGHVPVLAHAGERILSPSQTQNFHSLVNNPQSSQRGGDTHLNLTQHVNSYDRSGMRATLKAHASDLYEIINEGMRTGALSR